MIEKGPDPAGADEVEIPATVETPPPVPVIAPPRESKLWMVILIVIVLAIVGLLLTPLIRGKIAESERKEQADSLLIQARDRLGKGQYEAAESSAREVLELVPGNVAAQGILAEAAGLIEERRSREQHAEASLAAAETLVAGDRIVSAIAAYEQILAKPADFPEFTLATARERLAKLAQSRGTLTLPTQWPGDASISMDGQKQAPADSAITGIPLGSRSFEITRSGFRKPPPITLDFKGIRPIPLPQVAWQPFGGKVALSSTPAGAAVWIGGMDTGRVTPVTFDDVEVGKVEYTLKLPRHADTVVAGEVASLATLRLSAAMVETTSFPSAGKKAGEQRIFNIGPDLRVPFRWCPAGAFTMGGTDRAATAAEKPVRKVTLTQGFWLGETEFTQNQWAAIEGRQSLLLQLSNRPRGTRPPPAGQEMPIHSVSWDQICGDKKRSGGTLGKINAFLRRQGAGAWIADLPTEAQWEYACRAGTTGPFGTSEAGARAMDASSWHHGNSGGVLQPVGLKKANPWGFHDMHGNVREWTRDWYQGSYAKLPATNPTGPRSGWKIAVRGGSFLTAPAACRSSARAQAYASVNHHSLGFRLALRQMETAPKPK